MNRDLINTMEVKPNILFIEDKKSFREFSVTNLKHINCSVLAVENADEALECYLQSPNIDLVCTDIDLLGQVKRDKSGVNIARFIRQLDCDMPIIGYSSKFEDKELSHEEMKLFNSWYNKGKMLAIEINEMFDNLKIIANKRKEERFKEMCDQFIVLKEKNIVDKNDFEEVLGVAFEYGKTSVSQINSAIDEMGYKLILVNTKSNEDIKKPILLWIREEKELCEVEVYGFSDLFGFSNSKDTAIKDLLFLMKGFYEDMKKESDVNYVGPALKLRKFLFNIFKTD